MNLDHWPRRLPREITLPRTSLFANLQVSALRHPDKPAFVYYDGVLTWAEMHRQAEALAGWLQREAGVERGDRVILYMQNCPQFCVGFFGILRADAVVVPVNPMNRAEELKHYLSDTDAKVVICGAELAAFVTAAVEGVPEGARPRRVLAAQYADALLLGASLQPGRDDAATEAVSTKDVDTSGALPERGAAFAAAMRNDAPAWEQGLSRPAPLPVPDWIAARHPLPAGVRDWMEAIGAGHAPGAHLAGPDDLAVMPYTSGTTGHPKGCMHPHRTLMHNTIGAALWGQATADTVSLLSLPMFHVTGMVIGLTMAVWLGSTVVMLPRWNRDDAAALIAHWRVTHWTNIPTMVIDLMASPRLAEYDLSSLLAIGGGGAAMPEAVARALDERFGLQYGEGYGLSETMAPTHNNPVDRPKRQCLGIPFFGTEARVVDPSTFATMPVGEVGEIVVRGPQVFEGYWRRPDATKDVFVEIDGRWWFRTGDLGRVDEEGYFFITDRLKRMINASGFKVWPAEVETMLFRHPAVQEACVIASRDPYRGETVKAIVVPRPDFRGKVTEQEIIDWSREHMAAYKIPRIVEFADALPKSATGKVMWRRLQEEQDAARAE